jgi:hypothetical protein
LATIGLHSLFITIQKQANFDGNWNYHKILAEIDPLIHVRNHVCNLVQVEWRISPSNQQLELKSKNLEIKSPPYIISQDEEDAFCVRLLTSIATVSSLCSLLLLWPRMQTKQLYIQQPDISPPSDMNFQHFQPKSAYLKAGWLFLSSACVPNLELQDNITLELFKTHSEY